MESVSSNRMLAFKIVSTLILVCITQPSSAQDQGAQLSGANDRYQAGDLDGALQRLDSLLEANGLDQQFQAAWGQDRRFFLVEAETVALARKEIGHLHVPG